jgi:hypothetical protein
VVRGPDADEFLPRRLMMSSKKKTATIPSTSLRTIKIGSRVRCTDDGVDGRIV